MDKNQQDKLDKLDELKKLLNKFYELYGNLFKNRKLLDNNKTYQYFGARIFEQFQIEYQVLRIKFETIENPEIYAARVRHGLLVPRRRFGIFRNRAQKLIDRKVTQELDEYFKQQLEALERLNNALDEADSAEHRPTIFDEPLDDWEEPENADETQAGASDGEQLSPTDEPKDGENAHTESGENAQAEPGENVQTKPGENVQTKPGEHTQSEPPKTKSTRKKRENKPGTQPQNASEPNNVQLQGQIGIEELNESAEQTPGNADKPEQ